MNPGMSPGMYPGMTGSFRSRACSPDAGVRRWLALLLLALLADLSVSAASHRHLAPEAAPAALEQDGGPVSQTPGPPIGGAAFDDVCALCGALSGSAVACTSRAPLDLEALLAHGPGPLPEPILSASAVGWSSTASRAPPGLLS